MDCGRRNHLFASITKKRLKTKSVSAIARRQGKPIFLKVDAEIDRRRPVSPCDEKSLPAGNLSTCADTFPSRALKIRFGRSFSRPCGENSIRAGTLAFRARQLLVRAGKNPSVRPFFDLCGQKLGF
jgi:hypothetical protein